MTTAPDRLGQRAARGALVTLTAQALKILVQLASVVVLARLLAPHDYGLVAMVLALIGVGEIFRDFGLSTAAIQAQTFSTAQRATLFWINGAIGLALALAATPAVAKLHANVARRQRVHEYLQSPRRIPFNEEGIFRRYPELDA